MDLYLFAKLVYMLFCSTKKIWLQIINDDDKSHFFKEAASQCLLSYSHARYTNFDAHTTTNCCHGTALLLRNLLTPSLSIAATLDSLSKNFKANDLEQEVYDIVSLHVLGLARCINKQNKVITSPDALLSLYSISRKFCDKLVRMLQNHFSNRVALMYEAIGKANALTQKMRDHRQYRAAYRLRHMEGPLLTISSPSVRR
jgi:hypothetical protein